MSTITLPYDVNNGDILDADKVMANENAIVAEYNAKIGSKSGDPVLTSETQVLTYKTFTSPVLNTGVSGTAISTDSTMAANSDTILSSQKAVKAAIVTAVAAKVINRAFTWYLPGYSVIGTGLGARYIVPQNMTVVSYRAQCGTTNINVQIVKNGTVIQSFGVGGNGYLAVSTALVAGDVLTLNIDAINGAVCSDVIVTMECTQ